MRNHVTLRSQIGTQILILAKSFQSGRVPDFGTNVPKNERGVTLRSKIGAEILFFAKNFQEGRAPNFGAAAPKNERSVTSGLSGVILPLLYDKDSLLRCRNLLTKTRNRQPFP